MYSRLCVLYSIYYAVIIQNNQQFRRKQVFFAVFFGWFLVPKIDNKLSLTHLKKQSPPSSPIFLFFVVVSSWLLERDSLSFYWVNVSLYSAPT